MSKIYRKIKKMAKDLLYLPSNLAWLRNNSDKFSHDPKTLNATRKDVESILALLLLKEINPKIAAQLIPRVDIPSSTLHHDINGRYLHEAAMTSLRAASCGRILSFVRGMKSLPYETAKKIGWQAIQYSPSPNRIDCFAEPMMYLLTAGTEYNEVIRLGELLEKFPDGLAWRNTTILAWNAYLCALILTNREEKACEILHRHKRGIRLGKVENFLLLSSFAHTNGFTNPKIKRSSDIYRHIVSKKDELRSRLAAHQQVAVIGGGPYETNLGKGPEIDGHDVVVRCSPAKIDPKFQHDYGIRTDIQCVSPSISILPDDTLKHIHSIRYLFMPYCPDTSFCTPFFLEKVCAPVLKGITTLATAPKTYVDEMMNSIPQHQNRCLSTGYRTLYLLKRILNDQFSASDIYAFAFSDPSREISWATDFHYYGGNFDSAGNGNNRQMFFDEHPHNFLQEGVSLRKLFDISELS